MPGCSSPPIPKTRFPAGSRSPTVVVTSCAPSTASRRLRLRTPSIFGRSRCSSTLRVLGDLVYEICDTSLAYRRFAQKLFNETEPGFGKGTTPLVKIVETSVIQTANGSTKQITYQIEKWIPRPDAFAESIRLRDEAAGKQPAGAASTGDAYTKARGAEQPQLRRPWRLRSAASSTMRSRSDGLITLPFWQGGPPMIDPRARKLSRRRLR